MRKPTIAEIRTAKQLWDEDLSAPRKLTPEEHELVEFLEPFDLGQILLDRIEELECGLREIMRTNDPRSYQHVVSKKFLFPEQTETE